MHNNKEELLKDLIKTRSTDELEPDILARPLFAEMMDEFVKNSVERRRQLMRLEKEHLVDMVFNLESRNETLVNNLIEVEKMYDKLKGEVCMNTAVSLPNKNNDEATKIAMGYKYYIFEGNAEATCADMALLSEEEAEVIKRFFKNRISFYDEGYAGDYYPRKDLDGYKSKEEAVNAYMNKHCYIDPDDLVGEFKDMYKEEEE